VPRRATGDFYTVQPKEAPPEMEEARELLAAKHLELDAFTPQEGASYFRNARYASI